MSEESKDLLVVKSKVKTAATAAGATRVSGDFADALSAKVLDLVKGAAVRAKDNGRSTLRPSDL